MIRWIIAPTQVADTAADVAPTGSGIIRPSCKRGIPTKNTVG